MRIQRDLETVTIMLTALAMVGRLLLAAVFAVAGLAKLADRKGTRKTVIGFDAPERLAGALAVAMPLAELAVAGLLLPASTAAYGAIGAIALLGIFSVAIAWNLAHGRSPDCHCFGQLHSAPAGWRTVARNGALAAVAAFVVVVAREDAGPGAFAWTTRLAGVEWLVLALAVALGVVVAAGGYAVVHVLRNYGRVLVRLDAVEARLRAAGFELEEPDDMPQLGLEPGTPAPAFWLPSTGGDRIALGDLLAPARPLLLLFTSPTCGPCSLLMPEVARWQRDYADDLTVALLSDGDPERIRAEATERGLVNVLIDKTLSAYESYGANGTPSAVLVGADGTIASWLAAGSEWIETLVEQVLDGPNGASGLPVGAELPALDVELLDSGPRPVRELVDHPTVLLFWNPGCGFCRAMLHDVIAWEASPPPGAPGLIVVSAGATDDVRGEGFAATVVLDPDWALAGRLGANGTPMAVLVDEEGRIASPAVTGASAVLELLRAPALSTAH